MDLVESGASHLQSILQRVEGTTLLDVVSVIS